MDIITLTKPWLVAVVLAAWGFGQMSHSRSTFFTVLLRDLLVEQCSNWAAGGIQIARNPRWTIEGQMLYKWPLESEITRVNFAQFQILLIEAQRIRDQPFSLCGLVAFPLLFFCSIKLPLCQGVLYVWTIILNAVRNCSPRWHFYSSNLT